MQSPLVTADWLSDRLEDPRVVVADVRWYLKGQRGIDAYRAGHIPSAVFVDLDRDLASAPRPPEKGRHPLPETAVFQAFLANMGIGPDDLVIAYDDSGGTTASRLWWLMRYFGLAGGRVLDGGIAAWSTSGRALETAMADREPKALMRLAPRRAMVVDKAQVKAMVLHGEGLLLDARAVERFAGTVEPIDARPGHIPGAKSAPFAENLAPGGTFRPGGELASHYASLGAGAQAPIVAYCGSGVTACHDLLALTLAGFDDAQLYEGSWSEWAADPALPAALGDG